MTAGVAARARRPRRRPLEQAADDLAAVLATVEIDDTVDLPGTGPLAVGAIPFADESPGELIVPALVVGRTADGSAWVTEMEPAAMPASAPRVPG